MTSDSLPEVRRDKGPSGKVSAYYLFLPRPFTKSSFLQWLRNAHAWFGLTGACMGLFFAVTGLVLDHERRLFVHLGKTTSSKLQLEVPEPKPESPAAFQTWLKDSLDYPFDARVWAVTPKPVEVEGETVERPSVWRVYHRNPKLILDANYTPGDRYALVKLQNHNIVRVLTEFHKANMGNRGVFWVLLADVVGGAYVFLALTGMVLWTRLHGRRVLALGLMLGAASIGLWYVIRGLWGF